MDRKTYLFLSQIEYCNFPAEQPQIMQRSMARIQNEPVTVWLGNHPGNNSTLEKRAKQLAEGGNPFIDETGWHTFMTGMQQVVEGIIAQNREEEVVIKQLSGGKGFLQKALGAFRNRTGRVRILRAHRRLYAKARLSGGNL